MAVYITGDTHGKFNRFSTKRFPQQKEMTRDDYIIVCGDFGLWHDCKEERHWFDWLEKKPFTLLFVDGNHENFYRLDNEFPIVDFHGGKAHKIRENVYHLMRGYVFDFCGKKFFAFGGASSHDIQDGVLYFEDYPNKKALIKDYNRRIEQGEMLRINRLSWWKDELPTKYEMQRGRDNLKKVDYKVDYVISHSQPREVCCWCGYYDTDEIICYFDRLLTEGLSFKEWWSGHLHMNQYSIYRKYNIVYQDIVRII